MASGLRIAFVGVGSLRASPNVEQESAPHRARVCTKIGATGTTRL